MCPHGAVCRLHLGQVSTWEHKEGCGDGVWGWASAPRLHPAAMGSSVMEDEGPPAPWMSHSPLTCVPMHDAQHRAAVGSPWMEDEDLPTLRLSTLTPSMTKAWHSGGCLDLGPMEGHTSCSIQTHCNGIFSPSS